MKKFLKWSALFAVMTVLFAGCPADNGTGTGTGTDTPVSSIKILVNGSQESSPPLRILVDSTAQLSAQVLPSAATEKGYTFELQDSGGFLSLSEANLLTAVKPGQATIKVTSKGKKADGSFATDTLNVVVTDDPNTIEAKLLVYNQNAAPDAATTTALPALNDAKRYVIVNNEDNATLPGAWTSVAGNTIVYLSKPIKIQKEVVDETTFNYTPFSISARVRITGGRNTSTALNSTANCLVTGIFTDPTIAVSAATPLYFVGMRHAWNGQKRMYASRDSDNSAAAFNSTDAPDFDSADDATTKKYGFQEQEYVIKVERTTGTTYTISAYKADGTTLIASNTRGSGSNQANAELQKDIYYYLGFIVSGVTVEISNVIVKDGTETVFSAATDAVPDTVAVKKVNITTPKVDPGDGFDYQILQASFPSGGVQLAAEVIPTDVSKNVTWSISSGTNGAVSTAGLVTITGAGEFTVKAESESQSAEFKFKILTAIPPVSSITVTGTKTTIMAGNGSDVTGESITLTADVEPSTATATAGITWSVTGSDGTSATTAATINPTTGVLKASDTAISADTVVKVFASSNKGAGGATVKSEAFEVTVQKYAAFVNKTWNFSDSIWPWYNKATGYDYFGDNSSLDNLTFIGTNKWGLQAAVGSFTVGDMTFTHRVGANGAGSLTNRLLKFEVAGNCEIQLYMQSGGGNDRTVNVVTLKEDGTLDTTIGTKNLNDTDITYPVKFTYTGTDPATIGVYNSANNNFYCIKVVYP
jgi:hypothetical protein